MYVYEVVNTETGARGCMTSMFPDLEQGVTVRHKAYYLRIESRAMSYKAYYMRIESRAMSYKAALDDERLALLPVFD